MPEECYIPESLINLNGNLLCAVDVETTGLIAGWHEIVQIAVQPLDSNLEFVKDILPFYMDIAPEYPERASKKSMQVNGLSLENLVNNCPDQWRAADLLDEWFINLNLPFRKSMVPLAHNWAFEKGFLSNWLGPETHNSLFHPLARDSMAFAISINDVSNYHGKAQPFASVALGSMCKKFNIEIERAHDALCDARAEAQLYRALLRAFS